MALGLCALVISLMRPGPPSEIASASPGRRDMMPRVPPGPAAAVAGPRAARDGNDATLWGGNGALGGRTGLQTLPR